LFGVVSPRQKNESAHVGCCQPASCCPKSLAIEVLSKTEPISRLAAQHQVSRKFLYQQGHKANEALDATFSAATDEREALLPAHHQDLVISIDFGINPRLPLFVPGVVELLRDLFDLPISVGTIHNRLQSAADKAAAINLTKTCLQSEWDCRTKYSREVNQCWWGRCQVNLLLPTAAEHRDEDTWGVHLLDASQQGLSPDYTIAAARKERRASSSLPKTPCHGDIFTSSIKAKNWLASSPTSGYS